LAFAKFSLETSPRKISVSNSDHSRSKIAAASPIPPAPAMNIFFVIIFRKSAANKKARNVIFVFLYSFAAF
jgi:hypothetical protein